MGNCCAKGAEVDWKRYGHDEFGVDVQTDSSNNGPGLEYRDASPKENRTVEAAQTTLRTIRQKYGSMTVGNSTLLDQQAVQHPPQVGEAGQVYFGQWKWGKKHGRGVQVWPDGMVYEGQWMQGKLTGYGRLARLTGQCYVGEFFDNRFHGQGRYVNDSAAKRLAKSTDPSNIMSMHRQSAALGQFCQYQGMWDNDRRHGKGIQIWPDGTKYQGDFFENKKHGKGCFKWKDGGQYIGDVANDHIQGKGIYTWPDGSSYDGDWRQDINHGKGSYKSADGRMYIGQYVNGLKQGFGTFIWGQGQKYQGQWKEGKQHGQGIYTNSKGVARRGTWVNGKPRRQNQQEHGQLHN